MIIEYYELFAFIKQTSTGATCVHSKTTDQHLDNGGSSVFHVNFLDDDAESCCPTGHAAADVVWYHIGTVSDIPGNVQMACSHASAVALH